MASLIWLLRHGDTTWTEHERHTGRKDIPLSEAGRQQARRAGELLAGIAFASVLVSPQRRAMETARLAGLQIEGHTCAQLVEWDYGEYEGLTDEQTRERYPSWSLFRDGAPGGERPDDVAARADRLIERCRTLPGPCILVGHGKMLRALAARFIEQPVALGAHLPMDPAAVSILQDERAGSLLRLWNYTGEF
jgi:probable phosphoglycerate mutase